MNVPWQPKLHLAHPDGSGLARCGRGRHPRRRIATTAFIDDVTCEVCLNLTRMGTWSPVGDIGRWDSRRQTAKPQTAGAQRLERVLQREVEQLDG